MTHASTSPRPPGRGFPVIPCALALLLAFAPPAAWADDVRFKNGRMLQGEVRIDGDWVRIDLGDGMLAVPVDRVASIESAPSPQALAEARRVRNRLWIESRLDRTESDDAQSLYRVAQDARTRQVDAVEIERLLDLVLGADPDHAAARADRGQVRYGDAWTTPERARALESRDRDDRMRHDGFVRLGGDWVRPEHVDWLQREADWATVVRDLETALEAERRSSARRAGDLESTLATCRSDLGALESSTSSLRSDFARVEGERDDARSRAHALQCERDDALGALSNCESVLSGCESALGTCRSHSCPDG